MTQEAGTRRAGTDPPGSGRLRLALAAALIVVVLAGIRAARPAVGLHGPWHSRGTLIGVALEVVLAALMLAVIRRSRRTPEALQPAAQLRAFLRIVLLVALIATPAAIIINALGKIHLRPRPYHQRSPGRGRTAHLRLRGAGASLGPHFERDILYAALAVALLAVIVLCLVSLRRHRRSGRLTQALPMPADEDPDLSRAVQSGHAALRQVDDARAAIIACYAAMERSLAKAGAARGQAETPDELLSRAAAGGLVRGQAAEQLTSLFYEARFSSHSLPPEARDAAEQALDALAAGLPGAPR